MYLSSIIERVSTINQNGFGYQAGYWLVALSSSNWFSAIDNYGKEAVSSLIAQNFTALRDVSKIWYSNVRK